MTHASPSANYGTTAHVQSLRKIKFNRQQFFETIFTVATFIITLILIGLGMRILFALFVINDVFARGITIFTEPFISPFNRILHDSHEMLQVSTSLAFTFYYAMYGVTSFVLKLISKPKAF